MSWAFLVEDTGTPPPDKHNKAYRPNAHLFDIIVQTIFFIFSNVGVTIFLRNFNNTYSKDYLSLINKNYI